MSAMEICSSRHPARGIFPFWRNILLRCIRVFYYFIFFADYTKMRNANLYN